MKRTANRQIIRVESYGNTVVTPKPFAGRYPTRIRWRVTAGERVCAEYIGKPSRIAIQRLLKYASRPGVLIYFVEMDQRNILCQLSTDNRRFENARTTFYQSWNAYHPFTTSVKGWEWLFQPWWRIKINHLPVYSPVEKLDPKLHFATYTRWFAAVGWTPPREWQ